MQQLMQQTVPIATAIATRDETGFEWSERCSTFALSKGRKPRRQEIFDLLEQRTHSEGREGENEHEFHALELCSLATAGTQELHK